ncbi:MAG: hypothetical protein ACE5JG_11330 [Planctomycetota bacterium]
MEGQGLFAQRTVGLAALALLGVAAGLVVFDDAFAPAQGQVAQRTVVLLVAGLLGASLLHGMACVVAFRRPPPLTLVIVVGAAARLFLLFGAPGPGLEGDPDRLRLEGRLLNAGVSPYEFTPAQIATPDPVLEGAFTPERATRMARARAALTGEDAPDPAAVKAPHIRSIQTPLVHAVAGLADRIKPESTRGLAFLALVADTLAVFFLVMALRSLALPLSWVIVYAWSPILVKEVYGTLAVDAFVLPAIAGMVWCLAAGRRLAAAIPLALSAAVRPVMLVLNLALVRRLGPLGVATALVLVAAVWFPFVGTDVAPESTVQGTIHVWRHYEYNSVAESLARGALSEVPVRAKGGLRLAGVELQTAGESPAALWAKLVCAALLLALILFSVLRPNDRVLERRNREASLDELFLVLLGILIVSPVLHPWHALWLLPVLAVRPAPSWILLPGIVSVSYVTHLAGPQAADFTLLGGKLSFRVLEFGGFALLWLLDRLWRPVLLGSDEEDEPGDVEDGLLDFQESADPAEGAAVY